MNLTALGIPALRYATAVARTGSFSGAARECGVSQPTVSNAVAALEEMLGARLFERSTRSLCVTPAGEELLPGVTAVLEAVTDLERRAKALTNPSRQLLRIGFSQLVGAQRLALLFEPFAKEHPGLELIYKECSVGDMEGRLDANSVDVVCGVGFKRRKNRGRQLLQHEALRWLPPSGEATSERIDLREVARHRLVLSDGSCGLAPTTRALFARARIPIDEYAGHAMSYSALEEWADLGIGGAILPASRVKRAKSAALVQEGKAIGITYEAVWRTDLLVAQHAKEFVKYLRTVVPRIVQGGGLRPSSVGALSESGR